MTEDEVTAALGEFDTFWLTLWAECRSEPVEGQIAVASVIRTRARLRQQTYKQVCLAPKQFSCWNPGTDTNHVRLMDLARLLAGDHAERTMLKETPVMRQLKVIAQAVMNGDLLDNTELSDHYLTTELYLNRPPIWARGKEPAAVIGAHTFLRLG